MLPISISTKVQSGYSSPPPIHPPYPPYPQAHTTQPNPPAQPTSPTSPTPQLTSHHQPQHHRPSTIHAPRNPLPPFPSSSPTSPNTHSTPPPATTFHHTPTHLQRSHTRIHCKEGLTDVNLAARRRAAPEAKFQALQHARLQTPMRSLQAGSYGARTMHMDAAGLTC